MFEGTVNEIHWRTDGSSWPFSHFFMPFYVCLMLPGSWPPLMRVGAVVIASVLFELSEHTAGVLETKWDVCMDNIFAILGATLAVLLLAATNLPALHVTAMATTIPQLVVLGLVILGIATSITTLFDQSTRNFQYRKPDPDGEEGDTLYYVSWEFVGSLSILLATTLFIVKWRNLPMGVFYMVCVVMGLLASPLAVQAEDGKNLLYTGLIGCGIIACSAAYLLHRSYKKGSLPTWSDAESIERALGIIL